MPDLSDAASMVSLRAAGPEDAAAIAALKVICWRAAYKGLMPEVSLESLDADDETPHWHDWLMDGNAGLLAHLLWREGDLIGYGLAGPMRLGDRPEREIEADGELYALYIHPDEQRRGNGQMLLSSLIEAMKGRGYKSVGAWMIGGNLRAERFYLKLGAQEVGKRVEIHQGRIAYREKSWIWSDLTKLLARLTIRSV
ncbi:GNAT family N-acetyltransferase [uncultured Cohaesibacter sp.]|uniref:GNAT family N-acetyltransferase n=1 Tax=uncultured Cohaesibacter sp. TaxID=1002546 RepID=UPI0029C71A41|nr:GNAT family N-acetyltransferase [uncultured Cohaesibacter sp.]